MADGQRRSPFFDPCGSINNHPRAHGMEGVDVPGILSLSSSPIFQKSEKKNPGPSKRHPFPGRRQDCPCRRMPGRAFFKRENLKGEHLYVPVRCPPQSDAYLGKVIERNYLPGRFLVASLEKSSLFNEQNAMILESEDRFKILLVQIAGFVARRIVCYAKAGDSMRKGEIFGLIRFGSRVDLYLPIVVKSIVRVGQHVKGGESIIGYRA